MCGESILEECRERSKHLVWAGRFTAPTYMVGLIPRRLGMTAYNGFWTPYSSVLPKNLEQVLKQIVKYSGLIVA